MAEKEIIFQVTTCEESGGYVARWDDLPGRGGIATQGETLSELEEMIADAVSGYFEPEERPSKVKIHFTEGPVVSVWGFGAKLPRDVSGLDAVKALRRLGFAFSRQTGSHAILKKGSITVVVPQHRAIKPGTLKAIINQAGVSLVEFTEKL